MSSGASLDRAFVVTGACGGIGTAIVAELLAHGGAVVAVDIEPPANSGAPWSADRCDVVLGDVTNDAVVAEAFDAATRAARPLGGLVTCAYANEHRQLDDGDADGFRRTLDVLMVAAWRWGAELIGRLDGSPGAIVHVASIHAERTSPGFGAYAAAKAGVVSLTRSMAVEWGSRGVRANAVSPGMVAVERNRGASHDDDGRSRDGTGTVLGRWAKPVDVAHAVRFLLSHDAAAITGVCLPVDAGRLALLNGAAP